MKRWRLTVIAPVMAIGGFFSPVTITAGHSDIGVAAEPTLQQAAKQEGFFVIEFATAEMATFLEALLNSAKELLLDEVGDVDLDPLSSRPHEPGLARCPLARGIDIRRWMPDELRAVVVGSPDVPLAAKHPRHRA
jgi:hypothetical protein